MKILLWMLRVLVWACRIKDNCAVCGTVFPMHDKRAGFVRVLAVPARNDNRPLFEMVRACPDCYENQW